MLLFSSIIADPPRPCSLSLRPLSPLPPSPVAHRRCLPSASPLARAANLAATATRATALTTHLKKNTTVNGSDSLSTHWSAWYMSPPRLPTTTPECTTQPQTESPDPRVNSCPPCPFPPSSFSFQVTMRDGPNTPLLPVSGVKRWALVFWLALPTADAYPISPAGVSCRPTCGHCLVLHLLQL
jgi:hypothetical protein